MEVLFWLMVACMFGAASYAVASEDKKPLAGILGVLFGPVGLLVAALMRGGK